MDGYQNPPASGPRGVGQLAPLAAGAYTDIIGIYGPAEAAEGELVNIEVVLQNISDSPLYLAVVGQHDGVTDYFSPDYASVDPGAAYSFTASFAMPNKGIKLDLWSYFWTGSAWAQDDYEYVYISLKVLTPQFRSFAVADYSQV